jgi:hypothetical protein
VPSAAGDSGDPPAQGGIVQIQAGCRTARHNNVLYTFCTSAKSWTAARAECIASNIDIAIIDDAAENEFVRANGDSWVGTSDQDEEGTFRSIPPRYRPNNGALTVYSNWASGQPSNSEFCDGSSAVAECVGAREDEDCVAVLADGSWVDERCSQRKNYVCEQHKLAPAP